MCIRDSYIIDAHSIMGILSLDMTKPITLEAQENLPKEFLLSLIHIYEEA